MSQSSRALVIIDVQNEFLLPKGNFPCPEESTKPLVENLSALIPKFRAAGGTVIWVQAFYEDKTEAPAEMKEHEKGTDEWLTNATHVHDTPCCKAGTFGSEIYPEFWEVADTSSDKVVSKGYYSAFKETTELLDALREKGITDAYFCGVASGTCVLASVLDAVKIKEFRSHVVDDCLGFRRLNSHKEALERLARVPGLELVNSRDLKWIQE
ncbi:hypothetical protein VUR80DRAFT_4519 [Thermomyces stellatus]